MDDQDYGESFTLHIELDLGHFLMSYPVVKVYFASPLTDLGPEGREISKAVRSAVEEVLRSATTHKFEIYDPADHTAPGTQHKACEVYAIDHQHVENADVVFFFIVGPSTGMGMEAQIAAEATVPRVVIRQQGVAVTRMFQGAPSRTLATIEFSAAADIYSQLAAQVAHIGNEASISRRYRDEAREGSLSNFGRFLLKRRIEAQVSLDELSIQTDQTTDWLRRIERDPTAANLMSVPLLQRISKVVDVEMVLDPTRVTVKSSPVTRLSQVCSDSLDSLAEFAVSRTAIDDRRVLEIWRDYREERRLIEREAIAGREDTNRPIDAEQWKAKYDQRSLF